MSLLSALIDIEVNQTIHSEIRTVVKDFKNGSFRAIGKIAIDDFYNVCKGDPVYLGSVIDRMDPKYIIEICISEEEYNILKEMNKKEIDVCVWGIKHIKGHTREKQLNFSYYRCDLCRPLEFMRRFNLC
jgi:hypothetical protein